MLFILFKAIGKIFEYNIEYKMKINWPYTKTEIVSHQNKGLVLIMTEGY